MLLYTHGTGKFIYHIEYRSNLDHGLGTETFGFDNVFPADDVRFDSVNECVILHTKCLVAVQYLYLLFDKIHNKPDVGMANLLYDILG